MGALLTQGVALYSLHKNLQVAQNRDRVNQLKVSVNKLYSLQKEFEKNTKFLISERIELKFTPEKHKLNVLSIGDPAIKQFAQTFLGGNGQFYLLQSVVKPREYFSVSAWNPVGAPLQEVPMELSSDLSDFYARLQKINRAIDESRRIFERWGYVVPERDLESLRQIQSILSDEVAYVSQDRITNLTSRILDERKRLEALLSRL